ncbi:MAG TPA: TIGR02679 family protein [Actinomycetales bacterium]|nr:TIGR02679 family protein [Actinomycetales bacterium]
MSGAHPPAPVDLPKLQRLLGDETLAWLVHRVRDRRERGWPPADRLRLAEPTAAQRESLIALLGRRPRSSGALSVRVGELDAVLRGAGAAPDLQTAVVALTGPLRDRAGELVAQASAWERVRSRLLEAVGPRPALQPWAQTVWATGLLRRLAGTPSRALELLGQLDAVLRELPAGDPVLRSRLATTALHDAHGLDDDRPLTTLVLGAAAALGDVAPGEGAAARRRVWAGVRVGVGDLSAPALTLGLPGDGVSGLGRVLDAWRRAGEPVHLTLRQLTTGPGRLPLTGTDVYVCENPSVVAIAADVLGAGCRPLVCTHGQPSSAVAAVLDLMVTSGARLHYHGDFDWGGLRIAVRVVDRWRAEPWRYEREQYEAAVAAGHGGRALTDSSRAQAPWSPGLVTSMRTNGRAVEEEAVVADLLDDLAR